MHEAAWGIVQAIEKEDPVTGAEILNIPQAWWEKKDIAQAHVNFIRAVFGTAERLAVFGTPAKAPPGYGPSGLGKCSCKFFYVWTIY